MLNNLLVTTILRKNMLDIYKPLSRICPYKIKFSDGSAISAYLNLSEPLLIAVDELCSYETVFEDFLETGSFNRRFNHYLLKQLNGTFITPANDCVIRGKESISLYVEPGALVECINRTINNLSCFPQYTATICNDFNRKLQSAISDMKSKEENAPVHSPDYYVVTVDIILAKNQIK